MEDDGGFELERQQMWLRGESRSKIYLTQPLSSFQMFSKPKGMTCYLIVLLICISLRRHSGKRIHITMIWIRKIPWSRKWQPTPVFLSEKSHEQRRVAGCSPWGCKELDATEWLCISTSAMTDDVEYLLRCSSHLLSVYLLWWIICSYLLLIFILGFFNWTWQALTCFGYKCFIR